MKKTILTLTLILLSPIFAIPTIANPVRSSQTTIDRDEYQYQYADGAGNSYIIDRGSIEYRPITRAESSSGNYDGGAPRTVKITDRQYREVAAILDRALDLKSIHVGNGKNGRAKGTGMISKRVKDRQIITQVIAQNSQERARIEALLKLILKL